MSDKIKVVIDNEHSSLQTLAFVALFICDRFSGCYFTEPEIHLVLEFREFIEKRTHGKHTFAGVRTLGQWRFFGDYLEK